MLRQTNKQNSSILKKEKEKTLIHEGNVPADDAACRAVLREALLSHSWTAGKDTDDAVRAGSGHSGQIFSVDQHNI